MSLGMREFPPPLDLEARFGDMVRLVVVAGHDSHRFGQRLQPGDELCRVVIPQVVLGAAAQRREGEIRVCLLDGFTETLAAFVRKVDTPRSVEGEVAEPLFQEILGGHAAGQMVRPGDVGDRRKAFLEILGDGDDAVFAEQADVVRIVELPDHGVGFHPHGPFDHRLYAELVAYRQRQPAKAPRLRRVVRIAGHAEQQFAGIGFGKIGQENYACHGLVGSLRG